MDDEKTLPRLGKRLETIIAEATSKGCADFRYSAAKNGSTVYLSFRNSAGDVRMRRSISLKGFPKPKEAFWAHSMAQLLKSGMELYLTAIRRDETRRGA